MANRHANRHRKGLQGPEEPIPPAGVGSDVSDGASDGAQNSALPSEHSGSAAVRTSHREDAALFAKSAGARQPTALERLMARASGAVHSRPLAARHEIASSTVLQQLICANIIMSILWEREWATRRHNVGWEGGDEHKLEGTSSATRRFVRESAALLPRSCRSADASRPWPVVVLALAVLAALFGAFGTLRTRSVLAAAGPRSVGG